METQLGSVPTFQPVIGPVGAADAADATSNDAAAIGMAKMDASWGARKRVKLWRRDMYRRSE